MEATAIIGGVDCSNYIVFVNRHHSVCQMVSEPKIGLDPTWNQAFSPYDEVVIHEEGTKVFTGYVANISHSRMPPARVINCQCSLKKVRDYWLTSFETGGSTVPTLIDSLMTTVGVSYSINDSYAYPTAEEEWANTSVMDIFKSLLTMAGWQAYSDPDGVVQIGQLKRGVGSAYFVAGDNLIDAESARDDSWIRNAIAVYGAPGVSVKRYADDYVEGDFERAGAFANPLVATEATAIDIADRALDLFDSELYVVRANVLGDPAIQIGQTASVTESFTGLSAHIDMITTVRSSMSTDGYILDVTLGERCPTIWGFNVALSPLYAATAGSGVYRSDTYGEIWLAANGTGGSALTGDALNVYAVEASTTNSDDVWAGTDDGLFRSLNGGRTSWEWQDLGGTLLTMSGGSVNVSAGSPIVVAIDQDEIHPERVYFLAKMYTAGSASNWYQGWVVGYSSGSWTNWQIRWR